MGGETGCIAERGRAAPRVVRAPQFRHDLDTRYGLGLLYTLSSLSLSSFPRFLPLPCRSLGSGARRKNLLRSGQSF